jgi:uridine kinase
MLGVAGGTCSGKTKLADRLSELMGDDELALIKLDSYYWARDNEPFEQRALVNYDHPDAFDWPLLVEHVDRLCAGEAVPVPVYDYANHNRTGEVRIVKPASIVVIEGILVLYEPTLRDRFDLKVYVDTDADVRLIRRLRRDVAERGRSPDSIMTQYMETVRPSHLQFIEPSKRHADVIVPEGGLNRPAVEVLLARVRELAH